MRGYGGFAALNTGCPVPHHMHPAMLRALMGASGHHQVVAAAKFHLAEPR